MIAAWMLYSLLLGALVALGALAVDRAARAARMPRRWTWVGAMALLLVLTALAPWRAADRTAGGVALPAADAVSIAAETIEPVALRFTDRVAAWLTFPMRGGIDRVAARIPYGVDRAIGAAWALGVVGALASVWFALRHLDRRRRTWPRTVVQGQRVRVATHHGPAVYGVIDPDIVLPSALLACSADDQQIVLAHEDEHRLARDPLLLAMSAIGVALLPWHPLAWWMASRLRLAVELDCDARVLARGTSTRRYGELLVTLAGSLSARRGIIPALALLDSPTHLERRLLAMTTRPARRTPARMAVFLIAGASAVAIACTTDVPTAAQVRDADATTVVQQLGLPTSGDRVAYVVDGIVVSAERAREVRAEDIATIDVSRAAPGAATASEIRIVTTRAAAAAAAETRGSSVETPLEKVVGDPSELPVRPAPESLELRRRQATQRMADQERLGQAETVQPSGRPSAAPSVILRRSDADRSVIGSVILRADTMEILDSNRAERRAGAPLYFVDGVVTTSFQHIHPDAIQQIEVVKGEAARQLYGDRARNGVINITMKRPKLDN